MLALDNGENNEYGLVSVINAGMDRTSSCKGGKFTYGPVLKRGGYHKFQITDEIS